MNDDIFLNKILQKVSYQIICAFLLKMRSVKTVQIVTLEPEKEGNYCKHFEDFTLLKLSPCNLKDKDSKSNMEIAKKTVSSSQSSAPNNFPSKSNSKFVDFIWSKFTKPKNTAKEKDPNGNISDKKPKRSLFNLFDR